MEGIEEKIQDEFGKSWDIDDKYEEEEKNKAMLQTLKEIKTTCFALDSEEQRTEDIKDLIYSFEKEYGNV